MTNNIRKALFSFFFVFTLTLHSQNSQKITGCWSGSISKEARNWAVEINLNSDDGKINGYFNLPDYGLYNLGFTSIALNDTSVSLEYGEKDSRAVFDGKYEDDKISGNWDGLGTIAEFNVVRQNEHAEIFKTLEVIFENGDTKLSGTLVLPRGEGPFTAVVLIHGSGNQTRSEDFYRSRAYMLAKNGIAALIYDRRGKGKSTKGIVSMEFLADDALAGVTFLARQQNIKKNNIGLLGVSQGGYVAPLAVTRSNDVAFLVVVSAPGITPNEQNDFNVENKLRNKNVSPDSIAHVLKLRKDIRDFQYTGKGDFLELESSIKNIKDKPWFKFTFLDTTVTGISQGEKDFLSFNPVPFWEKIKIPILAIWGEFDQLVPAQISRDILEVALNNGMNSNYELKIFPNSNHGIAMVHRDNEFYWPTLASGYHSLIVSWIKSIEY